MASDFSASLLCYALGTILNKGRERAVFQTLLALVEAR